MKEKLPVSKQIAYSLGQFGWSLLAGIITNYLVFYYIPEIKSGIPIMVPQVKYLGVLTIIGLITMAGRFFDAVTDPWIATVSDRSKSKYGRRISLMRIAAVPFAVFTVLVFVNPIKGTSYINAVFLGVVLLAFYFFLTMYVTPFFALLSELGHNQKERINLSTMISITWFLGFAVSSQGPALWGIFVANGMEKTAAIRVAVLILSIIALIFLLIPVFAIDEKRYCEVKPSDMGTLSSIKATFRNREFRVFVFSDLFYWTALTLFQSSLLYYITVLLNLKEEKLGGLLILLGLGSFLFYVPVNFIAKKIGNKKIMIFAFIMFAVVYIFGFFLGKMPITAELQSYILIILAAIPMAVFGIIPNVVVADIAEYDASITGVKREGIFFGTRTFMSKMGQMISMFVLSALLVIERNGSKEYGIRLTAIFAGIFCIVGLILLFMYDENKVTRNFHKNVEREV